MGSFEEEDYPESLLRMLTEEERARLQALHQQLDAKFDEIASFLEERGHHYSDRREAKRMLKRWKKEWMWENIPPTTPRHVPLFLAIACF